MSEGPTNYICDCKCHDDPEFKHEGPCCFPCPKCKERIKLHLYNEHKAACSKRKKRKRRVLPVNPTTPPVVKDVEIPKRSYSFGSTATRHRKRKPVGR